MIVIDASAILAVYLNEPERPRFVEILEASTASVVSPVNLWETRVRSFGYNGEGGVREIEALLSAWEVSIAPITPRQADIAFQAHRRFGRGTRAKLNLGDCFAYALAKAEGVPLLFKGDDFALTDIKSAIS